jgi:hypothetical protein
VNGIRISDLGSGNDIWNIQIAQKAGWGANADGFIRKPDMKAFLIGC